MTTTLIPKWLEPFSQPVQDAIMLLMAEPGRKLACFDADGTLWNEDIGVPFFRWLIAGNLLPHRDCTRDIWQEYEDRVAENRAQGYAWAVQSMVGIPESDIVRWSIQMAAAWPNYRPAMADLARGLAESGFDVWIVSATNQWTVRAAAPKMNFDPDNVIAMASAPEGGIMTETMVEPLICNAGKVTAIQQKFGRLPDVSFGDSMGDFEMLCASRVPVVIGRNDKPNRAILAEAVTRGWPVHMF
ncbi:MAG TPA: HAD-IB family phosphatase [Myxococcota bacterium]|nr:HAD-IB family phosphatase [Myxococcota bacterium]